MPGGSRRYKSATKNPQAFISQPPGRIIESMYQPRLEVPFGFYHLCTRGNNKRTIFFTDDDRHSFLRLLGFLSRKYGWEVYAYCLMTNHYHVVLQVSDRGLSRGMCQLNGRYALAFNVTHARSNHLFGRRFWSNEIDRDEYLLESCRYVVLNPVRAGLCDSAERWPWSSYLASAGNTLAPAFLADAELVSLFSNDPARARAAYSRFVSEGHGQRQPPWEGAPR
jgi:REP element-mobilizing transposase RayT